MTSPPPALRADLRTAQVLHDRHGRPVSSGGLTDVRYAVACDSCVPCEKFSRNTSTPAASSLGGCASGAEAGPTVATILVCLMIHCIRGSGLGSGLGTHGSTSALVIRIASASASASFRPVSGYVALADVAPRHLRRVPLEDRERAQEMAGLAAPAAANLEVLAVDVLVRVDRGRPDVGVVAGDHVAAAVAHEVEPSSTARADPAASMTTSKPFAVGERVHRVAPLFGRGRVEVEDVVGAHPARQVQTRRRRADRDDRRRAAEPRERDGAQADGAGALHEHAVAGPQRGALEDVHGRQQAAAAADVVVERDAVGQPRDADAGLEIDRLRPAAEQAFAAGSVMP